MTSCKHFFTHLEIYCNYCLCVCFFFLFTLFIFFGQYFFAVFFVVFFPLIICVYVDNFCILYTSFFAFFYDNMKTQSDFTIL